MRRIRYIHEQPDWPQLTWDSQALAPRLGAVRQHQGRLLGAMTGLGFDLQAEAGVTALSDEVVRSSAIEGARLDMGEVRSSVARRLGVSAAGLPAPSREVDAVVAMMVDATTNCTAALTAQRLGAWQAALFPTGRSGLVPIAVGRWRDGAAGPMQVVSGPSRVLKYTLRGVEGGSSTPLVKRVTSKNLGKMATAGSAKVCLR